MENATRCGSATPAAHGCPGAASGPQGAERGDRRLRRRAQPGRRWGVGGGEVLGDDGGEAGGDLREERVLAVVSRRAWAGWNAVSVTADRGVGMWRGSSLAMAVAWGRFRVLNAFGGSRPAV